MRSRSLVSTCAAVALCLGLAACADESAPTADETETSSKPSPGVTDDAITIAVLNADLEPLREVGVELPERLTTEHLETRWRSYFDEWNAAGGIHGRKINMVSVLWNPLDGDSMGNACTEAVLDNKAFMVLNGTGFSRDYIPCFTEDNDTTFIYGDSLPAEMVEAAPRRLFGLDSTAQTVGSTTAQFVIDYVGLPDAATVGILGTDSTASTEAQRAVKTTLAEAGFEVKIIELPVSKGDAEATNAASIASVAEFDAAGVAHVVNLLSFAEGSGFYGEFDSVRPKWTMTLADVAASSCTGFGAAQMPGTADGVKCLTSRDSYATDDGELRKESEFEAECRAHYIATFGATFSNRSDAGVPDGEVIKTADGETLTSDYPPEVCSMVHIVKAALEAAGPNLTRDSFADAILGLGEGDIAGRSDGRGSFAPGKNTYADKMWTVEMQAVEENTKVDDNDTYDGCPAPSNCWVPVDEKWFPIEA